MPRPLGAVDDFQTPSVVPGGPPLLRWLPCELGPTAHCVNGNHKSCAHSWGGHQHDGVPMPSGYLEIRRDGDWYCFVDRQAGEVVHILPMHVWRCTCSCHTEDGATDLLGFIT